MFMRLYCFIWINAQIDLIIPHLSRRKIMCLYIPFIPILYGRIIMRPYYHPNTQLSQYSYLNTQSLFVTYSG